MKVKIDIDGQRVFEHPRFDNMDELEVGVDVHKYDLEEYYLPPVMRKILKTTKMNEIVHIRSTRRDKIIPYFEDPNGIFKKDLLASF